MTISQEFGARPGTLRERLVKKLHCNLGRQVDSSRLIAQVYVRCGSLCGLKSDISRGPRSATNGLMHCNKQHCYSITSSARARSDGGTVRPSVLAVWALMTSSILLAWTTGR